MNNKKRRIKGSLVLLASFALFTSLSLAARTDTIECKKSENECVRILIGNNVYIHQGNQVDNIR